MRTPPRERAHLLGYVGQDPAAGFVTDTVEEELAYGMEQLGLPGDTMRRRVEETLDLLGIAGLRSRDLRRLSGGEQQRVALGSVLTMHPRVLVLDEPTSALDPTAAEDVLATLTRLVHDLDVSVVLAEHRLERVLPFADTLVVLDGRGGVRSGSPGELLRDSPIAPPLVELGRAAGWTPLPLTVRDARRRAVGLRDRLGPPPIDAPETPTAGGLEARGVTVTHGATLAVHDVSLEAAARHRHRPDGPQRVGQVLAALGPPGHRPAARRDGDRRRPGSRRARRHRTPYRRRPGPAERRRPALPRDRGRGAARPAPRRPRTWPGWCPASTTRPTRATSPRVNGSPWPLTVVLADAPPVLLLDEPTRGLDYAAKHALAATLRTLAAGGRAVLVATHDVEFVAQAADLVLVLAEGEVVSSGPVRRVVAESPAFAPQVTKVLGAPWLRVDEVVARLPAHEVVRLPRSAPPVHDSAGTPGEAL